MAELSLNKTSNISAALSRNQSSQKCIPFQAADSLSVQALMTMGYILLFIFSFFGNFFVVAVFYKRVNQLRTPVNYFIVNMAASDLLVPLFVIPRRIQEIYLGWSPWLISGVLGEILCRVVNLAEEISVTVSSQSMVFIAIDRFRHIVFPTKSPLISQRNTPKLICFTWIFSVVFFTYYFFAFKLVYKDKTLYCKYSLPQVFDTWQDLWRADRISLLIIFVVIPFVLLIVFYTAIIAVLRRQRKITSHLSSEAQQRRAKRNQNITLMLVTVVVLFFISWTPHYVYFFKQYYSLGPEWSCASIQHLYLIVKYMNYTYTAVNPLVYYAFNRTYRQGFHQLICCPWHCLRCCLNCKTSVVQPTDITPNTNCLEDNPEKELELQVVPHDQS